MMQPSCPLRRALAGTFRSLVGAKAQPPRSIRSRTMEDVLTERGDHLPSRPGLVPPSEGLALPPGTGRPADVTEFEGIIRVTDYLGLHSGRNGTHELFNGQIVQTNAVAKPDLVDTQNVQVAMNVHSPVDASGLPDEVPLSVGEEVEIEGEYIPASVANLNNSQGPAAVLHFTHAPLGYAIIPAGGTEYR